MKEKESNRLEVKTDLQAEMQDIHLDLFNLLKKDTNEKDLFFIIHAKHMNESNNGKKNEGYNAMIQKGGNVEQLAEAFSDGLERNEDILKLVMLTILEFFNKTNTPEKNHLLDILIKELVKMRMQL